MWISLPTLECEILPLWSGRRHRIVTISARLLSRGATFFCLNSEFFTQALVFHMGVFSPALQVAPVSFGLQMFRHEHAVYNDDRTKVVKIIEILHFNPIYGAIAEARCLIG